MSYICRTCKNPLDTKDSLIICDPCYFKLAERENGKR
jgi:DNA-directed RNA polymerase subunit RPC12/RpoP